MISKEKKTSIINEYARKAGDTGSPEVQIAVLTARINELTGEYVSDKESTSLWVTCTASKYQFDKPFKRCSLSDDGVLYQTYSPRMAFLDIFSALYYAETGKLK